MDKVIEKWEEILSTVKKEHDISDVSFDTSCVVGFYSMPLDDH